MDERSPSFLTLGPSLQEIDMKRMARSQVPWNNCTLKQIQDSTSPKPLIHNTPKICNLQPGGTGTSPHTPRLNGPLTHEGLLRSSWKYAVLHETGLHFCCRQCESARRLAHITAIKAKHISPCKMVADEMAG